MVRIVLAVGIAMLAGVCGAGGYGSGESSASVVTSERGDGGKSRHCVTLPFRYIELRNSMDAPKLRYIEVFLDVGAFSEANLKTLFEHVAAKNPEPENLTVMVKTSWQQLPFPTDCQPSGRSNMPAQEGRYDYHQALFHRRDREEHRAYFTYNPVLKSPDLKAVAMEISR